jgi:hypothetical protein
MRGPGHSGHEDVKVFQHAKDARPRVAVSVILDREATGSRVHGDLADPRGPLIEVSDLEAVFHSPGGQ